LSQSNISNLGLLGLALQLTGVHPSVVKQLLTSSLLKTYPPKLLLVVCGC